MQIQTSNRAAAWQRRREEYLRAAGRYGDLMKEEYLADDAGARWSVFEGGRRGRSRNLRAAREARLYLVERLSS
jgi:hypothetical protein